MPCWFGSISFDSIKFLENEYRANAWIWEANETAGIQESAKTNSTKTETQRLFWDRRRGGGRICEKKQTDWKKGGYPAAEAGCYNKLSVSRGASAAAFPTFHYIQKGLTP